MDQGTLLVITIGALALVLFAWAIREIVGVIRARRGKPDVGTAVVEAAGELVPLLLQPIAALVKSIGKNRTSIDSLVGPDGTVSLVFSDIEGSTVLNRRLGDEEWVRVIRAHDEVAARTVSRNGGQIVKTQGDGFMAAFRTPEGAVGAAVALAPELQAAEAIGVPLTLRVGVHTGEVVSDHNDLFGTNVVMAARIADAARGSEVLVSDAVRDQLAGTDGFSFHQRRKVRFKGLPGRHRTHLVTSSEASARP
jgi:adenylate cyclase